MLKEISMGHYYWRSAVAVLAVAALSGSAALAADDPPPQPAPGTLLIVAGTGPKGFSGDGGPATQAQLSAPFGLAFDAAGNLFIAELTNARVRKVTPEGTINTVVGGGKTAPNKLNGIPAAEAKLGEWTYPSFEGAGNLFLSWFFSGRVWKVTPEGLINTVAQIDRSAGLAMDATGSLFIAV